MNLLAAAIKRITDLHITDPDFASDEAEAVNIIDSMTNSALLKLIGDLANE